VKVLQGGKAQDSFVYLSRAQWRTNRSKTTSWTTFSFSGTVMDDARHRIANVTFENVKVGDKVLTCPADGNFEIDPATTANIRFVAPSRPLAAPRGGRKGGG
jgi:hypothetical protein